MLTGAGVSAESGLSTYRDNNGLWDNYDPMEVASIQGWYANRELVLNFYNMQREKLKDCKPNAAHLAIAKLQQAVPGTRVITQNIDNLHERAGSTDVVHLHGEIDKLRSSINETDTVPCNGDQHYGDRHPDGSLLRPYIVFFGEGVPYFSEACTIASKADIMIVVGTSLNVYPAASLLQYAPKKAKIYVIDPGHPELGYYKNRVEFIQEKASVGVTMLVERLLQQFKQ